MQLPGSSLPAAVPLTVPTLLAALVASDSGRPRTTWYGADGERVELSARVLANWVAKAANLLVEEAEADAGTVVRLDLPPHWRAVVWALAASATGAELVLGAEGSADVVVTDRPDAAALGPGALGVAVTLPALARGGGDLPPGWLDEAAEVGGYADDLPLTEPAALAPATAVDPAARLLVPADQPLAAVLDAVVAALAADGSAVLVAPGVDVERIAAQERAQPLRTG